MDIDTHAIQTLKNENQTMDTNDDDHTIQTLKNENTALMNALDGAIKQLDCKVVGIAKSIEDPGSKMYIVRVPPDSVEQTIDTDEINKKYMEQQALQSVLLTKYNAITHRQKLLKNTARRAQNILCAMECSADAKSRSKLANMYSRDELVKIIEVYSAAEKARERLKQSISQCRRRATCLMNKHAKISKK